jgi:DNA-binding FrmR family transcriptional regulator
MEKRKEKMIIAVKKARTNMDKIILALESGNKEKCFEIIQQNLAVMGLLKSVNSMMLEAHLESYIDDSTKNRTVLNKKKMQQLRDEVLRIVQIAQNK